MEDTAAASLPARRPVVALLLYPGLTLLDLVAPYQALAQSMDVHLVWKDLEPVKDDIGVEMLPTTTFADCPEQLDLLLVPGGSGQVEVNGDDEVLEFVADRGARARYVASVCGGSLILGAAGLLRGYRAATHWIARELLAAYGAQNINERVVIDRNRITGGGVTAGLDLGLVVIAEMLGEEIAKITQLRLEYDPQPPFDTGSPEGAGARLTRLVRDDFQAFVGQLADVANTLPERGWGRAREAVRV